MKSLIEKWNGEAVVARYDRETGTWIFVALHSTRLGVPSGGTRMRLYATPDDGLADAMRLAEGMTYKWAAIDHRNGGGKAVLAVSRPLASDERRDLFRRYGALIDSLQGAFSTGADLGTSIADMTEVRRITRWVHGVDTEGNKTVDAGYYTALGVLAGLEAGFRHVFGSDDLGEREVLVQGLGEVGGSLAEQLAEKGARLLVSDIDEGLVADAVERLGAEAVPTEDVLRTECDAYSPCAIGGILNGESIPQLSCRIVAGSANNQLETPGDAQKLLERGILYAPDYVINAGAAMVFGLVAQGIDDRDELDRQVRGIGCSLEEIFREAESVGTSPVVAASRRVERILARGPRPE